MTTSFGTTRSRFPDGAGSMQQSQTIRSSASRMGHTGRSVTLRGTGASVGGKPMSQNVMRDSVKAGFASFADGEVEGEYIKNLQQQVYYLELEVNFLRGEVKKAGMASSRKQEAEFAARLDQRQQEWESQAQEAQAAVRQAEFEAESARADTAAAQELLASAKDSHAADKKDLVGQITALQRQLESEGNLRDNQSSQNSRMREDLSNRAAAFSRLESELKTARSQLEEQAEVMQRQAAELRERNADITALQGRIGDLGEQVRDEAVAGASQEARAWKDELYQLRLKMKQAEVAADQERALRAKVTDDCAALIQENAMLSSQLAEAQHSLDRERSLTGDKQERLSGSIQELAQLQDRERQQAAEIDRMQVESATATRRCEALTNDLAERDRQLAEQTQDAFELRERLAAMVKAHQGDRDANLALRREQTLLSDTVADMRTEKSKGESQNARLLEENERLSKQLKGE